MNNILFVGRFFSAKILNIIKNSSKATPGYSTHNYELAALKGLSSNKNNVVKSVTCPSLYSYPHHNDILYTPSDKFNQDGVTCVSVGFCNIVIINKIWSFFATLFTVLRMLKSFDGDEVNIICNLASSARAVKTAKILSSKKVKIVYMILDIPQMVSDMNSMNPLKSFMLRYANKGKMNIASNSDGLILMTEQMMDFISKPVKHVVIEGWIDPNVSPLANNHEYKESEKTIILYTGTLRRIFGIMNLVNAFCQIENENAELWLCGSGDAEEEIKGYVLKDNRIKFLGLVTADRARELQQEASILVNPRTSEGNYTKYSFPSKTLEYLLSGKPTIVYKLPGMPEEYLDYLFVPNEETVDALAEKIRDVINLPIDVRQRIGAKARDFILNNKTPEAQMSKVCKMMFIND